MEEFTMRVFFTFSKITLILSGLWMAIGDPISAFAEQQAAQPIKTTIEQPSSPANLTNFTEYYAGADAKTAAQTDTAPVPPAEAPKNGCALPQPGCEPACGTCAPVCSVCPHWIVGVEAVWLSPQYNTSYASYAIEDARDTVVNYYKGSLAGGLFITPRLTLGYQGDCWGVQIRYWRMSEPGNRFIPSNGYTDNSISYFSAFKAETADIEGTRLFCLGATRNMVSFGVRYAELDESSGLTVNQELDNALYQGSAFSRHSLSGAGLTMGLTGYRPINCRSLNFFYSLRGSVVWDASARNLAQTQAVYLTPADSAGSLNGALAVNPGSMFIGEIQLGVQWNFELVCNRADAFFRMALEYQYWDTTDTGYAASTSLAGNTNYVGTATATSGDESLDLIGLSIATGFTW
jgi:hypothetical protein